MGFIFCERNKQLEFDVLDYQYPDISIVNDNYDANWLIVGINYSDDCLSFNDKDPCLLTYELEEVIGDLDSIIAGDKNGCINTFLEPYLSFAVTRVDDLFAVQIRFVYDTSDKWKDVCICQGMNLQELVAMNDEFKKISGNYPYREVENDE